MVNLSVRHYNGHPNIINLNDIYLGLNKGILNRYVAKLYCAPCVPSISLSSLSVRWGRNSPGAPSSSPRWWQQVASSPSSAIWCQRWGRENPGKVDMIMIILIHKERHYKSRQK